MCTAHAAMGKFDDIFSIRFTSEFFSLFNELCSKQGVWSSPTSFRLKSMAVEKGKWGGKNCMCVAYENKCRLLNDHRSGSLLFMASSYQTKPRMNSLHGLGIAQNSLAKPQQPYLTLKGEIRCIWILLIIIQIFHLLNAFCFKSPYWQQ